MTDCGNDRHAHAASVLNDHGTSRRQFIGTGLSAAAGLSALGVGTHVMGAARSMAMASKPKRILFLGGTGFLGPHMVQLAIDNGHEVTLFNRGKSNPELFPDTEKLVGDRYGDLTALENREWDSVIDTFTYVPETVRRSVDLLAPNVQQYIVVSTISVYGSRHTIDMDETAPVQEVPEADVERIKTHREVGQWYGGMKALCEQTAEEGMPGQTCSIRPGLIVGPRDSTNRFTYWPWRVRKGGEVLSPGEPGHYTQFIDVRDLAAFIILAAEKNYKGLYNATSGARQFTMGDLLETSKETTDSDATFTWIDDMEFLSAQQIGPWSHLPAWVPPTSEGYEGYGQCSVEKALQAGMTIRPLSETITDTLAWVDEQPDEFKERLDAGFVPGRGGAGMSAEQEKNALEAWHAREATEAPG